MHVDLLQLGLYLICFIAGYLCRHFLILLRPTGGLAAWASRASSVKARATRAAADRRRRRRRLASKS